MQKIPGFVVLLAMPVVVVGVLRAQSEQSANGQALVQAERPDWAYGIPLGPRPPRPEEDGTVFSLPDTDRTFTATQIRGRSPADWYPDDHPTPMPDIVANGRTAEEGDVVRACALCHYPNGQGRPENAGVAGLPVSYFIQQMDDFRNDLRNSSEPRKNNARTMTQIAKNMTEEEIVAAAEYFGAQPWRPWVRVVETDTVFESYTLGGIYLPVDCEIDIFTECQATAATSGTEPIGLRIVETPENIEQAEVHRNPRSGWIAYVPVGAVEKGRALAEAGQCSVCHGPGLKGLGPLPGIAGRSASYLMRTLYDMQQGTRKGLWSELMTPVVADLSTEDLLYLVAYAASLDPQ
jgi:cytochrome c553